MLFLVKPFHLLNLKSPVGGFSPPDFFIQAFEECSEGSFEESFEKSFEESFEKSFEESFEESFIKRIM